MAATSVKLISEFTIDNYRQHTEDWPVNKAGTRPLIAFFRSFKGRMIILFVALVMITTVSQVFYKSSINSMHESLLMAVQTAEAIHAAENFHSASHVMLFIATNKATMHSSSIGGEYESQKKTAVDMLGLLAMAPVGGMIGPPSAMDTKSKVESLTNLFFEFAKLTDRLVLPTVPASSEMKAEAENSFSRIFDTYIEILHEYHDTRLERIKSNAFEMTRRIDFSFLIQLLLLIGASIIGLFFSNKALLQPYASVERQAFTDGLTGLWNRRYLDTVATSDIADLIRKQSPFSVFIMDIDKFKFFNDSFGHPAGDELLKRIASLFQNGLRESDMLIRYGGEEFLMILPGTRKEGAVLASEKLRSSIEAMVFDISYQQKASVTASFGVASYPEDGSSLSVIIKEADVRLYEAKTNGRNQVR